MTSTTSPLAPSRQLLLVTAPAWESTTAHLQRFQRQSHSSDWNPFGNPVNVSLGRSGLAWGIGLHGETDGAGLLKREGDGRATAGVFAITSLFGNAGQDSKFARTARLPYQPATPSLKCIDDPTSSHYNRIVDQSCLVDIDWNSHEDMLRQDQRYAVGAVIAHNAGEPVPGAGSCIFLHVWEDEGVPTAGCTAGALADITEICLWLDPEAAPVLVQLPLPEYVRLKDEWDLPPV